MTYNVLGGTLNLALSVRCRVDGGVSNNTFLMQLIANLTNHTLDRPRHLDMTSLGAAFLAGLAIGTNDRSHCVALEGL